MYVRWHRLYRTTLVTDSFGSSSSDGKFRSKVLPHLQFENCQVVGAIDGYLSHGGTP